MTKERQAPAARRKHDIVRLVSTARRLMALRRRLLASFAAAENAKSEREASAALQQNSNDLSRLVPMLVDVITRNSLHGER
jgi:hypothetical protein